MSFKLYNFFSRNILSYSCNINPSLSTYLLFPVYLERYVYHEEEIDEADVDRYQQIVPGFMDYDVSSFARSILQAC